MRLSFIVREHVAWNHAKWSNSKWEMFDLLAAMTVFEVGNALRNGRYPRPAVLKRAEQPADPRRGRAARTWLMVSKVTYSNGRYDIEVDYFGSAAKFVNRDFNVGPALHGDAVIHDVYRAYWSGHVFVVEPVSPDAPEDSFRINSHEFISAHFGRRLGLSPSERAALQRRSWRAPLRLGAKARCEALRRWSVEPSADGSGARSVHEMTSEHLYCEINVSEISRRNLIHDGSRTIKHRLNSVQGKNELHRPGISNPSAFEEMTIQSGTSQAHSRLPGMVGGSLVSRTWTRFMCEDLA